MPQPLKNSEFCVENRDSNIEVLEEISGDIIRGNHYKISVLCFI